MHSRSECFKRAHFELLFHNFAVEQQNEDIGRRGVIDIHDTARDHRERPSERNDNILGLYEGIEQLRK